MIGALTDSALLTLSRAGDRHAFDELVIRHYRAAFRTARAIVRSDSDAEDAVQDALVHAYTRLNSFRGDAAFRTWFVTIARNQAITRLRSERRRDLRTSPADDAFLGRFESGERSPEDRVLDHERRRHVARCIERLPEKLRDALRLAHSGRHSYEEMAAILGAPTGTIKSRVWIARRIVVGQLRSTAP